MSKTVTSGGAFPTTTKVIDVYQAGRIAYETDGANTTVATYSYDTFGVPTIWETFTNGWHNLCLYDGRDGARYDSETGLYWLSVRAYDPSLGRFISRDPLGRASLFFDASQPYVYGGDNPLSNTDPGGQFPFFGGNPDECTA